jgi:hypothetical protein
MESEDLWRAALHDFNNLLTSLQGVLDLSDPRLPLDLRNRARLEATLEDGKTLIQMARSLALGRHSDSGLVPWPEWKAGLEARMEPMAGLYRCPIQVLDRGAAQASWPAPLLQDWALAFTRQILPWATPGPLQVEVRAEPEAWVLTWLGDAPLPLALQVVPTPEAPRNLAAHWLRHMMGHLNLSLEATPAGLVARMVRPCAS